MLETRGGYVEAPFFPPVILLPAAQSSSLPWEAVQPPHVGALLLHPGGHVIGQLPEILGISEGFQRMWRRHVFAVLARKRNSNERS